MNNREKQWKQFFLMIRKINKSLWRLIRIKGEKTQITKLGNEMEAITINPPETEKDCKGIL